MKVSMQQENVGQSESMAMNDRNVSIRRKYSGQYVLCATDMPYNPYLKYPDYAWLSYYTNSGQ